MWPQYWLHDISNNGQGSALKDVVSSTSLCVVYQIKDFEIKNTEKPLVICVFNNRKYPTRYKLAQWGTRLWSIYVANNRNYSMKPGSASSECRMHRSAEGGRFLPCFN